MIIGIDGNEANVEKKVGVSVYTQELLQAFAARADKENQFVIFLRHDPLPFLPQPSTYFHYQVVKAPMMWSQVFLPLYLYANKGRRKLDVFFCPAHYAPRFCPVPTVVTIHDLSFFQYPNEFLKRDLYQLKNWTAYSIAAAKKIIAVSKTTKKDIAKYYPAIKTHIEVVYNGFEKQTLPSSDEPILGKYALLKKRYILYVGTIQPRKNIPLLIRAFQKFHMDHPEWKLVIVGKKGWLFEKTFETVKELGMEDLVVFSGYESDTNLIDLYRNAYCFVLPSLYEGFGIPILEAMSEGLPVLVANTASLPEIGGDAALYFDPHSVDDLVRELNELHDNTRLYNELVARGKKRVTEFSWSTCAARTLEVIRSAVNT